MANNGKRYSAAEKKAYYTGFGIGVADVPTNEGYIFRMKNMMTDKELKSFYKGREAAAKSIYDGSLAIGMRKKKGWF